MQYSNDESFNTDILQYKGFVLVDFFTDWCQPCKQLSSILEELNDEISDKIKIVKVDISNSKSLVSEYNIRGVPTLILFDNGEIKDIKSGLLTKAQILEWLNIE